MRQRLIYKWTLIAQRERQLRMSLCRLLLLTSSMLLNACGSAATSHHWKATYEVDHPLVGQVASPSGQLRTIDDHRSRQWSTLQGADIYLLGETHDHPDHHQLQAELIRAIKPKTVAFEMIDDRLQDQASSLFDHPSTEWDRHLAWTERGWASFSLYQPIFMAIKDVGARVIAAHPNRDLLMNLMHGKVDASIDESLKLSTVAPQEMREALTKEIIASHCGHASPKMVESMIKAQRLKDAWMARALLEAEKPVVLIVGRGHTRLGRGIPWALSLLSDESPQVKSIALLGVYPELGEAGASETADVRIYTPAVRIDDPCERFREQLKSLKLKIPVKKKGHEGKQGHEGGTNHEKSRVHEESKSEQVEH